MNKREKNCYYYHEFEDFVMRFDVPEVTLDTFYKIGAAVCNKNRTIRTRLSNKYINLDIASMLFSSDEKEVKIGIKWYFENVQAWLDYDKNTCGLI